MHAEVIRTAADLLWRAWQRGERLPALPPACRPATRAEGYLVQAAVAACSGQPRVGWKIAATSTAGQAHIGVTGPLAGPLLANRVRPAGAHVPLGRNHMRVAEAEFAFRLGRPLPPREAPYSRDEVLDAVASLHPAIEIPDSRYDNFAGVGEAQLIADLACAHDFVLGEAADAAWPAVDLALHEVTGRIDGRLTRSGRGANVLGDPRLALTWIANELSHVGIGLAAGEVITTGTCLTPLDIGAGDHVTADFGALGQIDVWIDA